MSKKSLVLDDVAVESPADVVAEVTADEAQTGEVDKFASLMLTTDDMLDDSAIPGYTVGQLLDMSPGEFWAKVGLYRSTKDESKIQELTSQRDSAIASATMHLPAELKNQVENSISKAFDSQLKSLNAGDDNAKLLGHYFKTGNIPGARIHAGSGPAIGADWYSPSDPWAMIYSDIDKNHYIFTSANNLVKGSLPEGTTWEDTDIVLFRIRGEVGQKTPNSANENQRALGNTNGYEFKAAIKANMSPSGINKAVQTFLKGKDMSVNGWQSLAIAIFNDESRPSWLK